MTSFRIEFPWHGYRHRADVDVVSVEDNEWEMHNLFYCHPLMPHERKEGEADHRWLDVSYLMDTSAEGSIRKAAEDVLWDDYDDLVRENFIEPDGTDY